MANNLQKSSVTVSTTQKDGCELWNDQNVTWGDIAATWGNYQVTPSNKQKSSVTVNNLSKS
ncbi:MAG: hypothetical protein WCQ96_03095 [Patescibacteria group bacterium]